jgi:hypothetical protein
MRRDLLSVLRVEIRRRLCGLAVAPEALSIVLVGLPVLDALGHFGGRGADLAAKNLLAAKERIEARLETAMDEKDLYLPHFLGTNGAAKLLSSAEEKPDAKASKFSPRRRDSTARCSRPRASSSPSASFTSACAGRTAAGAMRR